jgi:hypothetical protein
MAPLFLGLDLSTQQLKAVIISEDATVVHESAVHFDNDLPQYKTTNGAILGPAEGEVNTLGHNYFPIQTDLGDFPRGYVVGCDGSSHGEDEEVWYPIW